MPWAEEAKVRMRLRREELEGFDRLGEVQGGSLGDTLLLLDIVGYERRYFWCVTYLVILRLSIPYLHSMLLPWSGFPNIPCSK